MAWILTSLHWYIYLLILGIIFLPLTKYIFSTTFSFDLGYPFSKTLAIIFLSYLNFILGVNKIIPFTRGNILITVVLFFLVNVFFAQKNKQKKRKEKLRNFFIFFIEEVLFLVSFLFLVYIRSQQPDIHGLEKFMDFGFMNSILRSKYFPPLDIWLSANLKNPNGFPINYYYFGHLSGAFLIKLTTIKASVGYNLILATIFAQAMTMVLSICANLVKLINKKVTFTTAFIFGVLGSFIVNLSGNLHTIYLFTKGYPNDKPIPFWKILSKFNPQTYWYPNATRFIPFTIHEFPSYSYIVADLHGHVFDIPFVLLTIAVLILFFIKKHNQLKPNFFSQLKNPFLALPVLLGFLIAINYMTNAFDGAIYLLISLFIFLITFGISTKLIYNLIALFFSFFVFSFPFSKNFVPFASSIGVNCSPNFLIKYGHIGPFLFEKGNCQISPFWMLFVLWGFFWINFIIFSFLNYKKIIQFKNKMPNKVLEIVALFFSIGILFVVIPEFFYIKDIYPTYFRANTMFKLGYQAFILMGIASTITAYLIRLSKKGPYKILFKIIFIISFLFIFVYPFFGFPSYYGALNRKAELDGARWLAKSHLQDLEIINFLNKNVKNQPNILEAQGDSYTDYERISAYTGLPTVAGWWVHEWLWRGSSDVVGKRIPDIVSIYQSKDIRLTKKLLKKYSLKYVIISNLEREKYPKLNEEKFKQIGKKIFQSSNKQGVIYQVKY